MSILGLPKGEPQPDPWEHLARRTTARWRRQCPAKAVAAEIQAWLTRTGLSRTLLTRTRLTRTVPTPPAMEIVTRTEQETTAIVRAFQQMCRLQAIARAKELGLPPFPEYLN